MAADQHTPDALAAELAALTARLDAARRYNIGFPGATDVDHTPLAPLLASQLLNNIGDPLIDGVAANHTKAMEREVVAIIANLLRAPTDDWWGYVTTGGSEGNLYGLHLARSLHSNALCYLSDQAHFSMIKGAELLRLPYITVRTEPTGAMDYIDLADQLDRHRHRPAIIAATAGTTLAEAVDDLRSISRVLDDLAIRRRYLHVDAALSGIPLALLHPDARPGFDFADGADSITISGHKFLGIPTPCGIVITKASHRSHITQPAAYTGSPDATLLGSRSGHTPLMLWHTLHRFGIDGLRARADIARQLAAYTHTRLADIGWQTYRHPHAFTVVLKTPPKPITDKWVLATTNGWSHIITVPGTSISSIDQFLRDLETCLDRPTPTTNETDTVTPAATIGPTQTHTHQPTTTAA